MRSSRKLTISIVALISIFIIGIILGAVIFTSYVRILDQNSVPNEISTPNWKAGQYWTYSFKTPEIEDAISRMVVAADEGENYQIGVASRLDAQRHAVLNYNPMLGRIQTEDLSIFEKGIPQPLFSFPLKEDKKWTFSMFGVNEFEATVTSIRSVDLPGSGRTILVDIEAISANEGKLIYSYDESAKWIRSLVLEDSQGTTRLSMTLVSYGNGFAGEVYFVRGVDLYDREYTSDRGSPEFDFYNSFFDQGHPDWGPFEYLVYHYELTTSDGAGGSLTVTDPASEEAVRRVFGPNTFESTLGAIPSDSGEWKVTVIMSGECNLRLRIAGGIEYIWTV